MHPTTLFISYPRTAVDEVRELADQLEQLGQDVWLDQQLAGGDAWWDTILERIRTCDCFMFALCEDALQSKACRAELDYAHQTHRIILPMSIGQPVADQLLPRYLSGLQRVNAADPTQVARALLHLPEARPLPSPLPEPPPVPISYLDELAEVVDQPSLTLADQHNLVGTLRQRLAHGEDRDAALTLLHRLRRRSDVYAGVAEEIDAELARHERDAEPAVDGTRISGTTSDDPAVVPGSPAPPTSGPPRSAAHFPSPLPPPPPGPPRPRRQRRTMVAAGVAAGFLAVGGVGAAVALSGGDGGAVPPTPTPSESTTTTTTTTTDRPLPVDPVETVIVSPGQLPDDYGDDAYLDELADYCSTGSLSDCDALYLESPSGSAYEEFGSSCGATSYFDLTGGCAVEFDSGLNAGVGACDAGDMVACDALYWASPIGSLYEAFGAFCGLYSDEPLMGECAAVLDA